MKILSSLKKFLNTGADDVLYYTKKKNVSRYINFQSSIEFGEKEYSMTSNLIYYTKQRFSLRGEFVDKEIIFIIKLLNILCADHDYLTKVWVLPQLKWIICKQKQRFIIVFTITNELFNAGLYRVNFNIIVLLKLSNIFGKKMN